MDTRVNTTFWNNTQTTIIQQQPHSQIQLTCANCLTTLHPNTYVETFEVSEVNLTIHHVFQQIFNELKYDYFYQPIPSLKFCILCTQLFKTLLNSYEKFIRASMPGSYVNTLIRRRDIVPNNHFHNQEPTNPQSGYHDDGMEGGDEEHRGDFEVGSLENTAETQQSHQKPKWNCNECSEVFKTRSLLRIHENSHTGSINFHCSRCNSVFSNKRQYQNHYRKYHTQHTPKQRPGLSESDRQLLVTTDYKCHEESCTKINISFPSFREWSQHHLDVHGNDLGTGDRDTPMNKMPRPCPSCGKIVTTHILMLNHIRQKHTKERPFECEKCDKKFVKKNTLEKHILTVHVVSQDQNMEEFKCSLCGALFKSKNSLGQHEQRHLATTIEKKSSYPCDKCGVKCESSTKLSRHQLVHSNDRPFACDECGNTFKSLEALNLHKRRKVKKKEEVCELCGKGYRFKNLLKEHLITVHKYENDKARISAGIKRSIMFRILENGEKVYKEKDIPKIPCKICNRKYFNRQLLFTHLQNKHGKGDRIAKQIAGLEEEKRIVMVRRCKK